MFVLQNKEKRTLRKDIKFAIICILAFFHTKQYYGGFRNKIANQLKDKCIRYAFQRKGDSKERGRKKEKSWMFGII